MSNDIVLQLNPSPTNGRNSEASFITLAGGRILLVWSKFTSTDFSDYGSGLIASRYSDDDGRSWSTEDVVVVEQEGSTNTMSPSLLRLQDGRIALLVLSKEGNHTCMPSIRFSSDEAQSWTTPIPVIRVAGYYVVNNDRLIQMKNGRIMVPVALHRMRGPSELSGDDVLPGEERAGTPSTEPFFAPPAMIFYYFSDDGGQTWLESLTSYYICSEAGLGLQEPGVVELNDGRLWSWSRFGTITPEGREARQWESFSSDGGQVWSQPVPSQFVSPCSPMQVKRIPTTGHLLAVWNDHSGHFDTPPAQPISWDRTPLVLAISEDEGATWGRHLLLEDAPDHGFCYPAIHFTNDAVLLAYNCGGATTHICLDTQRLRRISFETLYASM